MNTYACKATLTCLHAHAHAIFVQITHAHDTRGAPAVRPPALPAKCLPGSATARRGSQQRSVYHALAGNTPSVAHRRRVYNARAASHQMSDHQHAHNAHLAPTLHRRPSNVPRAQTGNARPESTAPSARARSPALAARSRFGRSFRSLPYTQKAPMSYSHHLRLVVQAL